MNEADRDLKASIGELAARGRRELGDHPDPDELAAYHAGALAPADEERVRDHMVLCAPCGETLLDLARFADPEAEDGEGLPAGLGTAVWSGVLSGIHEAEDRPPAPVIPIRRVSEVEGTGVKALPRRVRTFQALAAALLLATIGLSLWVASLRRTLHEVSQPQLNAPVQDADTGTARSEGAPVHIIKIPADARLYTVILNPAGRRGETGFRVDIVRGAAEKGGVVWSGTTSRLNAYGSLSLTLTREAVGPGDYRIRLFAAPGTPAEELIGEEELHVEGP